MKKLLLLIIISLFFNLKLLAESVLKKRQISPIKESSNKVKKVLENISIQNDILSEFKIFEKASSKFIKDNFGMYGCERASSFFENDGSYYRLFITMPSAESEEAYLGIERY